MTRRSPVPWRNWIRLSSLEAAASAIARICMTGTIFVDSNIPIYAHDLDAGAKQLRAAACLRDLWDSGSGRMSTQVLQEFCVNVTRKISRPLSGAAAREVVRNYASVHVGGADHRTFVSVAGRHDVRWARRQAARLRFICKNRAMVRPERRVVLAGESPVRVSAGAPGSRLQPSGEIRPRRAECQKPLKQRGANQRAATTGERCSLVKLSAERCSRGPSRSCHGEGSRQHPGPEGMLDLFGVSGGGTLGQSNAEQERPSPAALSGKDRAYKAGWLKSRGVGRESEGSVVPMKACSKTRWREGSLLWSRRRGGMREGMPVTANNLHVKARQLHCPAIGVRQVGSNFAGSGEGWLQPA